MLIVSVSTKKYRKNAGKRAKKHTFVYFFDDANNVFSCKRINKIQAIYYKLRQKKKVRFTCPTCKRVFGSYGQAKKDITCPYCEKI